MKFKSVFYSPVKNLVVNNYESDCNINKKLTD